MENKFFTFIKPALSYIDSGHFFRQPFRWLYVLLAIVNLLLPIYLFYAASDNGVFSLSAKFVILFLLLWVIIAFTGWVSFQLWWDRKDKINTYSTTGDEFIATPVFSHFTQTFGEWLGAYIGIVGFSFAFLTTIFLGEEGAYLSRSFDLPFLSTGWAAVIITPIIGFLIVVISRFLSEQVRALAAIANNTKK
jgi:hypothetical protein